MQSAEELFDSLSLYRQMLHMTLRHVEMQKNCAGRYALVTRPPINPGTDAAERPTAPATGAGAGEELARLAACASACTRCKLAQSRTQVVFGTGPASAQMVVIGEAPGFHEDKQGKPFVGEAGQLLNKMLAAIRLRREEVYICNVLKCRPPENRDPAPDEIVACRDWLTGQLAALQPKLLLAMGKFASQALTGLTQPMGQLRGQVYRYQGIPVMCTYHPAHLLYHPEEKAKAWEDLQKVRQFLDTVGMH